MYRITKTFEFHASHVLSKHSGLCRYPHGHTYRVEVTLVAEQLDENDMVCDFGVLKAVVNEFLDVLDHSTILNSSDTASCLKEKDNPRKVILEGRDPSSETLAREIFVHVDRRLGEGSIQTPDGVAHNVNEHMSLEKVRVWESSTAWSEYHR